MLTSINKPILGIRKFMDRVLIKFIEKAIKSTSKLVWPEAR
jgi:hypothetical protein